MNWLASHNPGRFHRMCELAMALASHFGHGHFFGLF